jgi:hypothetical protein
MNVINLNDIREPENEYHQILDDLKDTTVRTFAFAEKEDGQWFFLTNVGQEKDQMIIALYALKRLMEMFINSTPDRFNENEEEEVWVDWPETEDEDGTEI